MLFFVTDPSCTRDNQDGSDASMNPVQDPLTDPVQDPLEDSVTDPLVETVHQMNDPVKDPLALDEPELVMNGNVSAERAEVKEEQMARDNTPEEMTAKQDSQSNPEEKTDNSIKTDNVTSLAVEDQNKVDEKEKWSYEDIEKLLNFVSKVLSNDFNFNYPCVVLCVNFL